MLRRALQPELIPVGLQGSVLDEVELNAVQYDFPVNLAHLG
jgi:hypothetical protein